MCSPLLSVLHKGNKYLMFIEHCRHVSCVYVCPQSNSIGSKYFMFMFYISLGAEDFEVPMYIPNWRGKWSEELETRMCIIWGPFIIMWNYRPKMWLRAKQELMIRMTENASSPEFENWRYTYLEFFTQMHVNVHLISMKLLPTNT